MKKVIFVIGCLLLPILLFAFLEVIEIGFLKTFGKAKQNVRREIFKETRSYNEGKIQDLARYKLQYEQSDVMGKEVIASTVRHMFADFNCEEMPYGLKVFLTEIRGY